MEYLDQELLEVKRKLEHQKHTTLEAGMYAGDELIIFTWKEILDNSIHMPLPEQFVFMPASIKNVKYPSTAAPDFIMTSLDSTVNISFNLLPIRLEDDEIKSMSSQFQNALKNMNPSIILKNQTDTKSEQGNEMSWFEYKGNHLDGQSFNRVYLIRLRKTVLHGTFSCNIKDKNLWIRIVDKIFVAVKEDL